jgi:hypothetical protein
MRTALMVAFVCDPYLAIFQEKLYHRFYKDEVSEVLVNVNGKNDQIKDWIADLWRSQEKVTFVDSQRMMRQGTAFNYLYPHIKDADVVMTMDSDNFIYSKGVVNRFVDIIESEQYGIIGSVGSHAYPSEVADYIVKRHGTVRINPFMSFWDKHLLDKLPEVDWTSFAYKSGDIYPPVGLIPADGYMEVMAKLTLDVLNLPSKFLKIEPAEFGKYVHVGGISQIFRRYFSVIEDGNAIPDNTNFIQLDYLVWRKLLFEATKDDFPFADINETHEKILAEKFEMTGVDKGLIDELVKRNKIQYPGLFL